MASVEKCWVPACAGTPGIKAEITSAVAQLPATSTKERARTAVFLAITSFQFQVIR